jgi:proteasome lid subunit RPN8/RPN11
MDRLTEKTIDVLPLSSAYYEQMLKDVAFRAPEEACGLLAGKNERITLIIPITNELHSPIRYRMDPVEQHSAFQMFEDQGWEMLGIYHSHPSGPATPSRTDINEAYYPDVVHLIWSPSSDNWTCRAFHIFEGKVSEILLDIKQVTNL